MENKVSSFVKGGLASFALFAVVAIVAIMVGGSARLDVGGALFLFVVGGVVGLIFNWVYQKGKQDGENGDSDRVAGETMADLLKVFPEKRGLSWELREELCKTWLAEKRQETK